MKLNLIELLKYRFLNISKGNNLIFGDTDDPGVRLE